MNAKAIVWATLLAGAGYLWFSIQSADRAREATLASSSDPAAIVAALAIKKPGDVKVERAGNLMLVSIDIGGIYVEGDATEKAIRIVPALLQRFPGIDEVDLRLRTGFQDRRGNRSQQDAVRVVFTRKNAATIRWENMLRDDVKRVADRYWVHPGARDKD